MWLFVAQGTLKRTCTTTDVITGVNMFEEPHTFHRFTQHHLPSRCCLEQSKLPLTYLWKLLFKQQTSIHLKLLIRAHLQTRWLVSLQCKKGKAFPLSLSGGDLQYHVWLQQGGLDWTSQDGRGEKNHSQEQNRHLSQDVTIVSLKFCVVNSTGQHLTWCIHAGHPTVLVYWSTLPE